MGLIPPRFRAWLMLFRPITLVPLVIGGIFGLMMVYGHYGDLGDLWGDWTTAMYVVTCLVLANAASNALNQVYDLDCDRINKPGRPLVAGTITVEEARFAAHLLYGAALLRACTVNAWFGLFVGLICFITLLYNMPPLRLKARLWWNTFSMAVSRGLLGMLAIWSVHGDPLDPVPWAVGGIITVFLMGGANVKDWPDYEGDKATGVRTLPTVYGKKRAGAMVVPWLWAPIPLTFAFVCVGILPPAAMFIMLITCPLLVIMTSALLWKPAAAVGRVENDAAWVCMYLYMAACYVGFAVLFV